MLLGNGRIKVCACSTCTCMRHRTWHRGGLTTEMSWRLVERRTRKHVAVAGETSRD